LFAIDPEVAFHGLKDLSLASSRSKAAVRREVYLDCVAPTLPGPEDQSFREHLEHFLAMSGIFILVVL
jgi:hypothetical protein